MTSIVRRDHFLTLLKGILYLLGQALGGAVAGGVLAGVYGRDRAIRQVILSPAS